VSTSGEGALERYKNCERYSVFLSDEDFYGGWDDSLASSDEARQL